MSTDALQRLSAWLEPPDRRTRWGLGLIFILGSAYFVTKLTALPAIEWMLQYRPEDFKTWHDLGIFLRQLRSGIPPPLAVFEISQQLLFGSMDLATKYAYWIGFILAFLVPSIAFARSRLQLALSAATCFVFLWSATLIVWQNPQTYDVYLPLAMMLALICVRGAMRAKTLRTVILWAAGAGLATSMMELLRPFGTFLVPVILLHAWMAWRGKRRAALIALAVPMLLLSGTWHLKLLIYQNGQIVWSNHGGTNLYNGWNKLLDEKPETIPFGKDTADQFAIDFLGTGDFRGLRLDSVGHTENSKIRGRAVTHFIVTHPAESAGHVFKGVRRLLAPQIVVYQLGTPEMIKEFEPKSPVIPAYRVLVWMSAAFAFANVLLLGFWIVTRRSLAIFAQPEPVIVTLAFLTLCAFVLGERGEEARFIASLLPLFGTYASLFAFTRNGAWKLRWLPARDDDSPATSPETAGPAAQ